MGRPVTLTTLQPVFASRSKLSTSKQTSCPSDRVLVPMSVRNTTRSPSSAKFTRKDRRLIAVDHTEPAYLLSRDEP